MIFRPGGFKSPAYAIPPHAQSWSATKDLHLHTTRALALEASASAVPPVADKLGEPTRSRTVIATFGGSGPVHLNDRLKNWGVYRDLHSDYSLRRTGSYLFDDRLKNWRACPDVRRGLVVRSHTSCLLDYTPLKTF